MNFSAADISKRLAEAFDPTLAPETPYPPGLLDGDPQPAAVLVPFLREAGQWHLLFIRRTNNSNDRHGGQVAYPGGRRDPEDPDAETAALREASEEVAIAPADVYILGRLRDLLTITNYRVTPIVGKIPWPYALNPQSEEVSRTFMIPLRWLADPINREVHQRSLSYLGDPIPVIYFKPYAGETLWGASARITMLLLEALGLSKPGNRYT